MVKIPLRAGLLALALVLPAVPALADADRPVTAEEIRQIETVLRREGFRQWGAIQFDGGRFEVEKAVAPDGRTFDLKLSNVDFIILERDPED